MQERKNEWFTNHTTLYTGMISVCSTMIVYHDSQCSAPLTISMEEFFLVCWGRRIVPLQCLKASEETRSSNINLQARTPRDWEGEEV